MDVYFVGDMPDNAIAKVEVAIEQHEWDIEGLLDTSEVSIIQTGSSMGSTGSSATSSGGIGGIAAAAFVVAAVVAFICYRKSRRSAPEAKAELDTDEESDDDVKDKKGGVPEVTATPVRN
mgnify:CR=1 FL=1